MSAPTSTSGRELWDFLPAVYRDRDNGDLALYLDACGELLDRLRATLDQRLADCFPEAPEGEPQAQPWLLPYFADLLDVQLLSPFADGRRGEVARVISWRQAKGTLTTVEKLAEAVGQFEVEAQEGWKRVAVTPRVDLALLPAAAFRDPADPNQPEPDPDNPLSAARHPGLPAATVDLRLPSRAIQAKPGHPLSRTSKFGGKSVTWRQLNPTGAPCFPGSYEDTSRRTVDLRTPSWKEGHFHPRQVLLFVPPPTGFFPADSVKFLWSERQDHEEHFADSGGDPRRLWNPSRLTNTPKSVTVTTRPPKFVEAAIEIDDVNFQETLTVKSGRVVLRRVAALKVVVETTDGDLPVLEAYDCLFDEIEAKNGLVLLDACTVMTSVKCRHLQASDCLFAGEVAVTQVDAPSCLRYSRIPAGLALKLRPHTTTAEPAFFTVDVCDSQRELQFGDPGYGVLHPATPDAITFGAEDGGEMGAGHHRRYRLAWAAVTAKAEEFLPVGMKAVLIPDPRLLVAPPLLHD